MLCCCSPPNEEVADPEVDVSRLLLTLPSPFTMSFPFYTRSSQTKSRSKDNNTTPVNHRNSAAVPLSVVAPFANPVAAVHQPQHTPGHARTSSKMRIPFLGKKRKSMISLRNSSASEVSPPIVNRFAIGHRKTVSQLADE